MYASAMSIIVIASGPNDSDNSNERMQPSMLSEVVLSGGSIEEFPIIGFYLYHVTSAGQSSNWTTSGIK